MTAVLSESTHPKTVKAGADHPVSAMWVMPKETIMYLWLTPSPLSPPLPPPFPLGKRGGVPTSSTYNNYLNNGQGDGACVRQREGWKGECKEKGRGKQHENLKSTAFFFFQVLMKNSVLRCFSF